jgi:Predicted transcriptional regulator containing an HTH domain and an uncharacterized domain shared with the mammalian protein Schlafen
MEDHELEALLGDIESDRAERKATLSDRDRIREAICAFANDLPNNRKPGVVFVGGNDDGTPSGVEITDQMLLTLADMRSDGNVTPFPTMLVQKRNLRGRDMAVVVVQPADAPPVRYKGRVYVRVGPRRAIATPEEERRLSEKRRARDLPFDIRPLPSALAPEVLEQNQRSVFQQLTSLRFVGPGPDANPTPLGLLVAGKDARHFLPGAYIQFVRFDGLELTDPIKDQREIDGPLTDLLRMSEEVFEAHVSTALDIGTGLRDARSPDFPIAAFRQLLSNAVLHRTYEGTNAPVRVSWFRDRIEILSPGGPYGQVNRSNFGDPGVADYRNPHLAEAMKNLGYIQRFGLGIQIARRELERNGNPALEFKVEDSFVWAILRRRQ